MGCRRVLEGWFGYFSFYTSSTGQVSDPIHRVATSQSPVFLGNSRYPLCTVAPSRAPFLPKVQGQFAEFLHHDSLIRLRFFNVFTCVGFGYGVHTSGLPGTGRSCVLIQYDTT